MKLYKSLALYSFAALLIGATSCQKNFESRNTNPAGMENEQIPLGPRFVIPMQTVVFNVGNTDYEYQLIQNLNGDVFSGYMMSPTPYGGNINNLNYFMMIGWNGLAFEKGNSNIIKPIGIILNESWRINYVEYAQIAKIIRVAAMHKVTDIYGPIPYSKAGHGGIETPYDSQEDIYKAFFKDLKEASDSLDWFIREDPAYKLSPSRISEFDMVCGGNVALWLKYANTLRLRLAMRVAGVDPTLAKEQAEAAIKAPGGLLQAGDNNVALSHRTVTNPLYVMSDNYTDIRMGAPMESILKGYKDPRIELYFRPVAASEMKNKEGNTIKIEGEYHGIRNGIDIQDKTDYVNATSSIRLSHPTTESPMVWMVISESYFLRAEGALRGWEMGGSAESFYSQGVAADFAAKGISGELNDYLNGTSTAAPYTDLFNKVNSVPEGSKMLNDVTVKWDNSDSKERQLQRIITQKWIAMFPDGHEGWAEFRRTGYPKLFTVMINNSDGTIPTDRFVRRLPFPDSEIRTNKAEVDKAVANLLKGPDTGGTRVWWDIDAIVTGDNKL